MVARRRRKTRRKSKPKISLLAVAEAGLMTTVLFRGCFDTTIPAFFFPGQYPNEGVSYEGQTELAMTGAYLTGNSISLGEFFGVGQGAANATPIFDQLKENLKDRGLMMAVQLIAIPTAFRMGRTLLRVPINQVNRAIAATGIKAVKI